MLWLREGPNPVSQTSQTLAIECLHLKFEGGILLRDPAGVGAQVQSYRKEDQNAKHGLNDLRLVVEAALTAHIDSGNGWA